MKTIFYVLLACASSMATGQTSATLMLDKHMPNFSLKSGAGIQVAANTTYSPVMDLPKDSAIVLKRSSSLNTAAQALQGAKPATALTPLQPAVPASPLPVKSVVTQPTLVVGQPAAQVPVPAPAPVAVPAVPPAKRYELRVADLTIRAALERWLKTDDYQDIVWDLREDLPIERDAFFEGDLQNAIGAVMVALRNTQLPTRACMYSNKVVRVIPATRFCNESAQ